MGPISAWARLCRARSTPGNPSRISRRLASSAMRGAPRRRRARPYSTPAPKASPSDSSRASPGRRTRPMRIFAASLGTETNTFSPIPTSYANFEASFAYGPGEHPDAPKHTTAPLYVARKRAARDNFTLIEGSCFWAEPSGTCVKADYEMMRDRILGELEAALPLDGVLLGLHGAMVAHGYDDCEGDLLERARK